MQVFWAAVAAIAAAATVIASGVIAWRQNRYVARQTAAADAQVEFAAKQLAIAEQMRKDSAQPYVYADVGIARTQSQVMVMSLSNQGATAARDVEVWTQPELRDAEGEPMSTWRVPTLGPGAYFERVIDTGPGFYDREDYPSSLTIYVKARGPFGDLPEQAYKIDLDEYCRILAIPTGSHAIEQAIKGVKSEIQSLAKKLRH